MLNRECPQTKYVAVLTVTLLATTWPTTQVTSSAPSAGQPLLTAAPAADRSLDDAVPGVVEPALDAVPPSRLGPTQGSSLDVRDVPAVARLAYQRAASTMAVVDKRCHLSWTLLAAVGEVESDHGRSGDAVLRGDGVSSPLIRGAALDGRHGAARVPDTDDGTVDGDKRWDRAVGPMQIVPSTWNVLAVDADGDGVRSPDDLDDAALAVGVFLCGTADDLRDPRQLRSVVHTYDSAPGYTDAVLRVEATYRHEANSLTSVTTPTLVAPEPALGAPGAVEATTAARPPATRSLGDPKEGPGTQAVTTPPVQPVPHPSAPVVSPGTPPVDGPPPEPTPDPTPTPTPTPPAPEPSPEPPPPQALVTLSGTLEPCGDTTWCVGDVALDLGGAGWAEEPAASDFDGDSSVETKQEELTGLTGRDVELLVVQGPTPAEVRSVNGDDW